MKEKMGYTYTSRDRGNWPPSSMDERLLLDLPAFQKLLEAAWVLQNHVPQPRQHSSSSATTGVLDFLSPVIGITASASVRAYEAATANVAAPLAQVTIPIANPLAGKTSLAVMSSVPATSSLREQEVARYETSCRSVALAPLPSSKLTPLSKPASVIIRVPPRTRAAAGPATVLLIVFVFVASYVLSHRSSLMPVKAAFQGIATAVEGTRTNVVEARSTLPAAAIPAEPPKPETSHLRVTDFESESTVEDLSRYEMQTVRRQAQFGDDDAALTLGLAYEIGSQVPQNCTLAAHWILLAAEQGNAAAEYNLALRYLYGDGTAANALEARKWFQKAARQGNHDAATALREGL